MTATLEEAMKFAILTQKGVPQADALAYIFQEWTIEQCREALPRFRRLEIVRRACLALESKPWEEMSLEEVTDLALEKTRREAAYYLTANNYAELGGAARTKADACRQLLETWRAGMAGKHNELTQFFDDLKSGKLTPMPVSPRLNTH